ncbi:MAG: hypothetical protein NC193_10240 [bacterium]|nr:hypothetical protein [bacterium]
MTLFNPDRQVDYTRDLQRVHTGHAPALCTVAEAYGTKVARAWLQIQLSDLSEFSGCRGKLTDRQMAHTAEMLLERCRSYRLTEMMLFFVRFKCGDYGQFYGCVDPMRILQAVKRFEAERQEWFRSECRRREDAEAAEAERELEALRESYRRRVTEAWGEADTPPIDFTQYRLMGYAEMTDTELSAELAAIASGDKEPPGSIIDYLRLAAESAP